MREKGVKVDSTSISTTAGMGKIRSRFVKKGN
jgi:hypothetical protein